VDGLEGVKGGARVIAGMEPECMGILAEACKRGGLTIVQRWWVATGYNAKGSVGQGKMLVLVDALMEMLVYVGGTGGDWWLSIQQVMGWATRGRCDEGSGVTIKE